MDYFNYKVLTLIWFLLPVYLFIGLLPIPFWYHASIRWVVLAVCIYLAILSFTNNFIIIFVLMLCIVFLFRPIYPFILEGIIWITFNIAAIVLISITIYYIREELKRKAEKYFPDLSNNINN